MEIARACEGRRVTAADRAHAGKVKRACRYGDSAPCLARLPYGDLQDACRPRTQRHDAADSYLASMSEVYRGCAKLLAPGGYLVLVTKNMRAGGRLTNLAGDTTTLCESTGLVFWQHIVALLATVTDDSLRPRPSLWQLLNLRHALAAGERTHLVCHEDVLVFQKPTADFTQTQVSAIHSTRR